MQSRHTGTAPVRSSDFVIRVHDNSGGIMSGTVEHSSSGDYALFRGLLALLEVIQDRLDELAFPQATMALRKWDLPPDSRSSNDKQGRFDGCGSSGQKQGEEQATEDLARSQASRPQKSQACFVLRIQFRHNACWQGSLSWLEGKKSVAFRSVLELLSLLGSALDGAAGPGQPGLQQPAMNWSQQMSVS